jgi:hypothetical protein
MMKQGSISVLCSLCEADPPEVSWQGIIESENGAELEELVGLGALVQVDINDAVLCLACDEPHAVGVEHLGGGVYRGYCPIAGFQSVHASLLRRYAVDLNWVAAAIGSVLGLKAAALSPPFPIIAKIGRVRFGPYLCQLFVTSRLASKERFQEVERTVSELAAEMPVIVLTTTPTILIPGKPPARCALLQIEDVLVCPSGSLLLNEEPIYAALRGPTRNVQAPGIGYSFSPGYRSARIGDNHYEFTDKQALAIEALYIAWGQGLSLHQSEIQGAADTTRRVGQLFGLNPAYGTLIISSGKGLYTLAL